MSPADQEQSTYINASPTPTWCQVERWNANFSVQLLRPMSPPAETTPLRAAPQPPPVLPSRWSTVRYGSPFVLFMLCNLFALAPQAFIPRAFLLDDSTMLQLSMLVVVDYVTDICWLHLAQVLEHAGSLAVGCQPEPEQRRAIRKSESLNALGKSLLRLQLSSSGTQSALDITRDSITVNMASSSISVIYPTPPLPNKRDQGTVGADLTVTYHSDLAQCEILTTGSRYTTAGNFQGRDLPAVHPTRLHPRPLSAPTQSSRGRKLGPRIHPFNVQP